MFLPRMIFASLLIETCFPQFTKLTRQNVFLLRKKRYLRFPEKSNFVITISMSKALLRAQPTGHNLVLECDVPFPLPEDTRLFKGVKRRHYLEKREVLARFEEGFTSNGLDGRACVKRMICETQVYSSRTRSKSLVLQILSEIFTADEGPGIDTDMRYQDSCHNSSFANCALPLLNYVLGSLN